MSCSLRTSRFLALVALFAVLAFPFEAFADRGEFYTLAETGPALLTLTDPPSGHGRTTALGLAAGVTAYYGLTNSLALGAEARMVFLENASFSGLSLPKVPTGTLYENVLGGGLDVLVAYRLDTGYALAPIARLQFGGTYLSYGAQELITNDLSSSVSYPDRNQLVWGAAGVIGVEYRFGDSIVASLALAARYNLKGLNSWQFELPLSVGWVW